MLVSHVDRIRDTDADASGPGWRSLRFGLKPDRLGFTMTETTIDAGVDHVLWYKHHIEAVYVIEGKGEVEDLTTGELFAIGPGSFYALDRNDRHRFAAHTTMKLVCTFTPPLSGHETHDADGSYLPDI